MCYCSGNSQMVFHEVIISPDFLDFLPLDRAVTCLLQDHLVFSSNYKGVFINVSFIFLIIPVSIRGRTNYQLLDFVCVCVCVRVIFSSPREIWIVILCFVYFLTEETCFTLLLSSHASLQRKRLVSCRGSH